MGGAFRSARFNFQQMAKKRYRYEVVEKAKGYIPTSGKPYGERTQAQLRDMFEHGGPIHKLYIKKVEKDVPPIQA